MLSACEGEVKNLAEAGKWLLMFDKFRKAETYKTGLFNLIMNSGSNRFSQFLSTPISLHIICFSCVARHNHSRHNTDWV